MQGPIYNLYAGVYKHAVELFNSGGFIEAFNKFKAVVENDPDNYMANYFIAECYFNGLGTNKNYDKAFRNYQISAAHHHPESQYMIGLCYELGLGVSSDETQAVIWYSEATKVDYLEAEYRLGMCYKEGRGIEQSYPLAATWLLRAAQKGKLDAKREAALCYEELDQPIAAATLFLAAAEDGDLLAEERMAEYYAEGYGCPKCEGLAIEFYIKACNRGSLTAKLALARRYAEGDGLTQDINQAVYWWMKCAGESTEAQYYLAECYLTGNGVILDYKQGLRWLERAAEENSTIAMLKLAEYSMTPLPGFEKDEYQAKLWWTKAAALGDPIAMYNLGRCYEEAIGVSSPNYKEAFKWYRLAKEKGNELAAEACKKFSKGFLGTVKIKTDK